MHTVCKFLITLLLVSSAVLADFTPKKVGPVSYYGALHTNGNKIVGAKNGKQVMLRGVSLYWSDATGIQYYKKNIIDWATDNLKIDVFRFAMGIQYYDSNGGTNDVMDPTYSYKGSAASTEEQIDRMVAAAIENDVYIIVDWHSHRAHYETSLAKDFFSRMSKKYKDVPNVIYEIYNEPVSGSGGDWGTIKNYANQVVPAIRANTENLIIVGTPNWSQHPEQGARNPISATNIAYVLHFYAATHSKGSYGGNVTSALEAGYPVFISEWGSTNADGDGDPNTSATNEWTQFMDQYNIPNCNWSFRQKTSAVDGKSEKSAFFEGKTALITEEALSAATLTTSGSIVKSYLTKNARSWADSLTKGKRGSCSFAHVTAKETDGTITGKLKSGCTYTSSDPSVVTVSGSNLEIKGYGYSVLTGNDGSQTVVTIQRIAGQTINRFSDLTCRYNVGSIQGGCSSAQGASRSLDYDADGTFEWVFPPSGTTDQGAEYTLTSLNPTAISVAKGNCTIAACSKEQKAQQIWMYNLNNFGSAKIVATAAKTGNFRAMQDTITVYYRKAQDKLPYLKNYKFALGETVQDMFREKSDLKVPVTYTFDGQATSPYVTRNGSDAVAGNTKAVVTVVATTAETDSVEAMTKTVVLVIGDTTAPDAIRPVAANNRYTTLKAHVSNRTLFVNSASSAPIDVEIYDLLGNRVVRNTTLDMDNDSGINLNGFPKGSYIIRIRQQSQQISTQWLNR